MLQLWFRLTIYLMVTTLVTVAATNTPTLTLETASHKATFKSDVNAPDFGILESFTSFATSSAVTSAVVQTDDILWSVDIHLPNTPSLTTLQSTHGSSTKRSAQLTSNTSATLQWQVPLSDVQDTDDTFDVTLLVSLSSAGLLEYRLSFTTTANLSLWKWQLWPASGSSYSDDVLGDIFEPSGFGVVHHAATKANSYELIYPRATMQFMQAIPPSTSMIYSTYVAAHDPSGNSKSLSCQFDATWGIARFSISAVPPNAGVLFSSMKDSTMEVTWPIVVAILAPNTHAPISWFDGAAVYRTFALSSADWTKQGPLSQRDDVPEWSQDLTGKFFSRGTHS